MPSEFSKGAAYMRDNVMSHIIGMQNDLGNDVNDKRYQQLQELLEFLTDSYGEMFGEFIG